MVRAAASGAYDFRSYRPDRPRAVRRLALVLDALADAGAARAVDARLREACAYLGVVAGRADQATVHTVGRSLARLVDAAAALADPGAEADRSAAEASAAARLDAAWIAAWGDYRNDPAVRAEVEAIARRIAEEGSP